MPEEDWKASEIEVLEEADRLTGSIEGPEQLLRRLAEVMRARIRRFSWVGFYRLAGDALLLGPHSGRDHPAHFATLTLEKGPQGLAASRGQTVLMPSLRQDPRWLDCPVSAISDIVVPVKEETTVYGEIDVDSRQANGFDMHDRRFLETLAQKLVPLFRRY